jgi:glycosyltransferase involved in cell wall biosynthesis
VKVLLVTTAFPPYGVGGISSHVGSLAAALADLGHAPWVLASRRGQPRRNDEASAAPKGVRPQYVPTFASMARRIRSLVRAERFDVVHLHAFNALALAPLVRRRGTAIVFTLHSDSANYLASVRGWSRRHPAYLSLLAYERLAIRFPDATIAVSRRMEDYGRAIGGRRIVRIPNAVDCDYWSPPKGAPDGRPPTILVPRMHVPKNGIEFAIEAMGPISAHIHDARMLVTGDGPLRGRLEDLARHAAGDRIAFPGMVSQDGLRALYRRVDVVMIPSITTMGTQENTSIAALEAMACGTPVVATDIGGLPEVIPSGTGGLLVPERDPAALAQATLALLTRRAEARRMGEAARRHVVRGFSTGPWARRVLGVYEDALASLRRPGGRP